MTDGMTVADVIGTLRLALGAQWKDAVWDGLQAGSMDSPVSGVAVTWAPGLAILKDAVAKGCNLILCKDPVYWYEAEEPLKNPDSATSRVNEGIVGSTPWSVVEKTNMHRIKQAYIAANKLHIYRMSSNWDGGNDLALNGLLDVLGWKMTDSIVGDQRFPNSRTAIVDFPAQALVSVAQHAKNAIGSRSTRVLGDRGAKIAKIAVHPGFLTIPAATKIGQIPALDAILTGETNEWESMPYAEDWISAGHGKGLIMTGLAPTSDTAVRQVAAWVRQLIPAAKVEFLTSGDPFTAVMAGGLRA